MELLIPRGRVYDEFIVVFAMVTSMCICAEYDLQSAMKLKQLDMEYGEKLTSVEQVAGRSPLKFTLNTSQLVPSTRCTTGQPIKLNSDYVPESSDERNENKIENDVQNMDGSITTKKSYIAPSPADNPHYIDDER
ncbi:uncharacterized protein LOC115450748 isoform X5 [Manduca sexta]|uniref:Uncharacterized protein n=2 Tax=Manduca sexta TaxID=7130 RepID=A0A921ZPN1_MANSE|nr:uncharacterized protein LOC115450748 isoform X5 [Manduca sexta]KAG6461168.1 hypothetical protein O3G_MSEX012461 [Manduca sexta]